jgi:hypothetical protein
MVTILMVENYRSAPSDLNSSAFTALFKIKIQVLIGANTGF